MQAKNNYFRILIFILLAVLSVKAHSQEPIQLLIDDFEDGDLVNEQGIAWWSFNDEMSGGNSTISFDIDTGANSLFLIANYSLEQGSMNFDPSVGLNTDIPININKSSGVTFSYIGSNITFRVETSNIYDYAYYRYILPSATNWDTITINWEDLYQPLNWGEPVTFDTNFITGLSWEVQTATGTSDFFMLDVIYINDYIPTEIETTEVTFSVDMQNEYVDPDYGVHLVGSFVNWDETQAIRMENIEGSIYQTTLTLPIGANVEYKFNNGFNEDWGTYETLDGLFCATSEYGNRFLTVENNFLLPTVCYNKCEPCTIATEELSVSITQDNNFGYVPFTVNFNAYAYDTNGLDVINGLWEWNFGDGNFEEGNNLSSLLYIYETPGIYTVNLKVTDQEGRVGTASTFITVEQRGEELNVDFWADNYSGYAPFTVNFSDYSNGNITSWEWSFNNDTVIDSYEQYPTYTYTEPGIYSVRLTIYNAEGQSQSLVKDNLIEVWDELPQQEYCTIAIPTNIGLNFHDFNVEHGDLDFGEPRPYIWYSYTSDVDKKIIIDLCNTEYTNWIEIFDIYTDCYGNYKEVNTTYCENSMSSTISLTAGETVYFMIATEGRMSNEQGFNFEIKEIPSQVGEFCNNPLQAQLGAQTLLTDRGNQWYTFTPPGQGHIVIQIPTQNESIELQTYFSCNQVNEWYYGNNIIIQSDGTEILFNVKVEYSNNLPKEMNILFIEEGEVFADFNVDKKIADIGYTLYFSSSSINVNSWEWDFDNDGTVDSYDQFPSFQYSEPGIYTVSLTVVDTNATSHSVVKEDYILIYEVQSLPYCEIASNTINGENAFNYVNGLKQWFTYTPDFDGELQISLCNNEYSVLNYIYTDCDNTNWIYSTQYPCGEAQGNLFKLPVTANQPIYFEIEVWEYNLSGQGFTFELIPILPQPGDYCTDPIIIEAPALFSIDYTLGQDWFTKWYSYTASENVVVEVNTCQNLDINGDLYISLYSSCGNFYENNYIDYSNRYCIDGNGEIKVFELNAGETVLIEMHGYNYDANNPLLWKIITRDYYEGEVCKKPISASIGLNSMPENLEDIYYSFVAPETGIATLTNCDSLFQNVNYSYSGVFVTSQCDDENAEIFGYASDNCYLGGSELKIHVIEGQAYYINWYTSQPSDWTLTIDSNETLPQGTSCDNPIVLNEPSTYVESLGNIIWYEMQFPENGMVEVSSDIQTEASVIILENCKPLTETIQGDVEYAFSNTGLVFWPEAGKTYKLLIIFHEEAPIGEYEMRYQFTPNSTIPPNVVCSDAETVNIGSHTNTLEFGNYWARYTATQNAYLKISDIDNSFEENDIYISIFDSCSNGIDNYGLERFYDYNSPCGNYDYNSNIWQVEAGQTVLIHFSSYSDISEINWELKELNSNIIDVVNFYTYYDYNLPQIDKENKIIHLHLVQSAILQSVPIYFELATGNTMYQNFNGNHNYICNGYHIDIANGMTEVEIINHNTGETEIWNITATQATSPNTASNIISINSYNILSSTINESNKNIDIILKADAGECIYDIELRLSAGAYINNEDFINNAYLCFPSEGSGITLRVYAENRTNFTDWTITYTYEELPQGSTCEDPLSAILGMNTVSFDYEDEAKIFSYTVQNTGLVRINACGQNGIMPIIANQYCEEESIVNPEPCIGSYGYINEIYKERGEVIIIALAREEVYNSQNVYFSIEEISEQLPLITDISLSSNEATINIGEEFCFDLIVTPSESSFNVSKIISGNILEDIGNNCYKANREGVSTITFTSTDGTEISASINITAVSVPVELESITLPDELMLQRGESYFFNPVLFPENASNNHLVWNSSDDNVAFIDIYGNIAAVNEGTTIITATNSEGIISNECIVTVSAVYPESIMLNRYSLLLNVGDVSTAIYATVLPTNASNRSTVWISTDSSVAQIINNNQIKAIGEGTTTVRVQLQTDTTIFEIINITVLQQFVDKSELAERTYYATMLLQSIEQQELIGTASGQYPQEAVAEFELVISDCFEILENEAATLIEVTDGLDNINRAIVNLENSKIDRVLISSINIIREIVDFVNGESKQIFAYLTPTNATSTNLEWRIENTEIATVSQSGVVTALQSGLTYLYVNTTDGSDLYDSCLINVRTPLRGIELPQTATLVEQETRQLSPTISPTGADVSGYIWNSDNELVVTVNQQGQLSAIREGIATISVREVSSNLSASMVVMVRAVSVPVTGIELEPDSVQIVIGTSQRLYANLLPIDATNSNISWSSSSQEVYVDNTGLITAFNLGSSIITATTVDGGFADNIKIIVIPSELPQISEVENIIVETCTQNISLNLIDYVTDDNTDINDYQVNFIPSNNFNITYENGVISIVPTNPQTPVSEILEIEITDSDNQSVTLSIPVEISNVPNSAPRFTQEDISFRIIDGGIFAPADISMFVTDDYTSIQNLEYEIIESSSLFRTILSGSVINVSRNNAEFIGIDSILLAITDEGGLSAVKYIKFEVSQLPNTAPTLSTIPEQSFNDVTRRFPTLDLKNYVSDDYTLARNIEWTHSSNSRLNISIWNGVATITVADQNWTGSVDITFTATDEEGLTDQTIVTFTKITQTGNTWAATPAISFTANQTIVAPNSPVIFSSAISGATSWQWHFEGGTPNLSNLPNPTVTFENAGNYKVKLAAMNDYGTDSLVREAYITVLGLQVIDDEVCMGEPITIQATVDEGLGYSYEWSTGSNERSIQVQPNDETVYSLIIRQGLFEYHDEVSLSYNNTDLLPSLLRPHKEEIGVVTFAENGNSVLVVWERTLNKRTEKYEIFRETSENDIFEKIGELPFGEESVFEDLDADARTKSYRYKIATIDSVCGNKAESTPHRSIHVQNFLNTQMKANLSWRAYEGIDFSTYKIYRGTNQNDMVEVDAVTSQAETWTDSDNFQYGWVYRVAMVLPDTIETRFPLLKAESGPFSQALSNIAELTISNQPNISLDNISVYPTIAKDIVTVSVDRNKIFDVEIVNIDGKMVYTAKNIIQSKHSIPVSSLSRGNYTVIIEIEGRKLSIPIVLK